MEAAAVIIALIFAVLVALAVVATVRTVKAVKRGVDRTVTQARRTVEDTRLKARQYTVPGAAGEVAQLRLSLRTTMRATQEALRLRAPDDPSLSESLALFERLSAHGHELDDDLRRLETEPSRSRVDAALPEMRERTERIREAADSLRWAAQDRARRFSDDDLADLSEQIRMEAGALRHWAPVDAEEAEGAAGTAVGAVPPDAPSAPVSASAPSSAPSSDPEPERPAIAGRDRWRKDARPWEKWQKNGHPESTS
ncbi:hypothetical protein [Streptomyces huiliensis]|uniref:hypothetical protein n=1 Tax=Streptomyces huiliensis TaxID=2876027 RepID=UPI001CBF1EAD|nr:hypothetical protein [Streptomyces huiliensis]MBZ4318149.1 hypothetical protein [Streptomyces huiliensis]